MQQRGEETRSRILRAALGQFSEFGYSTASVEAICLAAGVSKGALYHHFPSKHALFLALLDGWLQQLDAAVQEPHSADVQQTLRGLADAFQLLLASARDRLPMFLEFWLQASRDQQVWQAAIAPYRRYHSFFTTLIERGKRERSIDEVDASIAARLIVSVGMGLLLQSLLDPEGASWDQVSVESMETLLRGLRPSP
jgi:AcrR family transcriptional regulator